MPPTSSSLHKKHNLILIDFLWVRFPPPSCSPRVCRGWSFPFPTPLGPIDSLDWRVNRRGKRHRIVAGAVCAKRLQPSPNRTPPLLLRAGGSYWNVYPSSTAGCRYPCTAYRIDRLGFARFSRRHPKKIKHPNHPIFNFLLLFYLLVLARSREI